MTDDTAVDLINAWIQFLCVFFFSYLQLVRWPAISLMETADHSAKIKKALINLDNLR